MISPLEITEKKNWPRERLCREGVRTLSDADLLAILIGTGHAQANVMELSQALLDHGARSLGELACEDMATLMSRKGIKLAKASKVAAAMEIANRVYRERMREGLKQFTSSEVVGKYLIGMLAHYAQEHFLVLILNQKHVPIAQYCMASEGARYVAEPSDRQKQGEVFSFLMEDEVSKGSVSQTIALPREVFRKAVLHHASAVILAHNHPTGDVQPSPQDKETTDRLVQAGNILGIRVLDHFIVGKTTYYSFLENGLM